MEPFKLFWIVNLLLPVLTFVRVEATVYYELVPHVTLKGTGLQTRTFIGEFASYSRLQSTPESQSTYSTLVFVDDGFGCPGNDTEIRSFFNSILLLRLTHWPLTHECTNYEQASAAQRMGAEGVIFYYTPNAVDKSLDSTYTERLSDITVVVLGLDESDIDNLLSSGSPSARIDAFYRKSFFRTSHTFYFVVFAFCILMLLSCLWCILSYIRRCQYNVRNRRRRAQNETETRLALSKLTVRTHKTSKSAGGEDQTCVICLEAFCNNETIRILPCKHEFHKRCVDPWLKLKRTCPICKRNITKDQKRRMGSCTSSRTSINSNASSTATQESNLLENGSPSPEHQPRAEVAVSIDEDEVSVPNTLAFV